MYIVKTEIKESRIHGKGYFAGEDIPLGTIVYFHGLEDIIYSRKDYEDLDPKEKKDIFELAVEDEFGNWVFTKTGPYTNHSCDANILEAYIDGIYFSIAVKNIRKGEEITIDYGLFYSSIEWKLPCHCKTVLCRKTMGFGFRMSPKTEEMWTERIANAVQFIKEVSQPLFKTSDPYGLVLKEAVQNRKNIKIAKQIKFSLISG